jgi:alkanesulfonate monooxygenase SsuD/methylene tetrahydromethanopterin reductase-like flavin-dependent oxidoreductase (luciferase family)
LDNGRKSGIALRPQVIPPNEIVKLAKVADQSVISHLFIPDIRFDSLEISAACLSVSKALRAGSGVFRPLELDLRQLVRRLETLQAVSDGRYLLGIGTGDPGQDPAQKTNSLIQRLEDIRAGFDSSITFPESYVAALRSGIARKSAGKSDGILLNFCPPGHAKSVVDSVRKSYNGKIETACYLKTFFSKSADQAKKLAIEEFVKYNTMGHYHRMFELSGLAEDILLAARNLQQKNLTYSDELARTCPVNPEVGELRDYISGFREAGISLPVVYPYFVQDEDFEYKLEIIRKIISASE